MRLRMLTASFVVVLSVACGGGEPAVEDSGGEAVAITTEPIVDPPPPFVLTRSQERGKEVYESVCWSCHGSAGRGDGPAVIAAAVDRPPDFTTGMYPRTTGRELESRILAALQMTDPSHPHMQNVRSYLAETAFGDALAYIPALGYPPEIAGSAIAGQAMYALRCKGCHGADGRGAGDAVSLLEADPADFTFDSLVAARNFNGLFQRIQNGGSGVHGSSMPTWGVLLTDGEIWDLVAYIGSFQEGVLSDPPTGGSD
ncbi:MAG: c-type cytochrome [Gemmatimonadetes bacterium]|nr:c-type cytochrome [Gemmatimonadota bacterium]